MADLSPEVQEAIDQGVELCRSDEWKAGLDVFAQINLEEEDKSALPAEYYSYLGYCVARFERRLAEGVKLCEHAAAMNQNSAEVLYNLARDCPTICGCFDTFAEGKKMTSDELFAAMQKEIWTVDLPCFVGSLWVFITSCLAKKSAGD